MKLYLLRLKVFYLLDQCDLSNTDRKQKSARENGMIKCLKGTKEICINAFIKIGMQREDSLILFIMKNNN